LEDADEVGGVNGREQESKTMMSKGGFAVQRPLPHIVVMLEYPIGTRKGASCKIIDSGLCFQEFAIVGQDVSRR